MFTLFVSLLFSVLTFFRPRLALQAEILALRHQLLVLQRSSRAHKLRLSPADRALWVWLSRLWTEWRSALIVVKPETVIGWHRLGFRPYWRWKSRHPSGRPSVSSEVADLIRRMSLANPRWGAPRLHGELRKLGIAISQATVAKYMPRHRKPPSQNGRTFLENHMQTFVSTDFFVVPTITSSVRWNALEELLPLHRNFIAKPVSRSSGSQLRPKPRNAIPAERPLPRNDGKARFVVCPLCRKPGRALYGWRVNRRRTNSVFLTSC